MTRDGGLVFRVLVATAMVGATVQLTSATASESSQVTDPGWITGQVVDANGDPVKGDLVNALGPREVPEAGIIAQETDRRALTDANGAFKIRQASPHGSLIQICNPEPSDKTVCKETAQGVDHVITYVGPAGVTDSWVLQTGLFPTSDTDRDLGTVEVKPQSFVHGHLAHGAFQSIQLLRLNGTVASYNGTDENGDFRFVGLAPGRYRIGAGGNGSGWLPWRSDIVTLRANEDTTVDGVLERGADIHGVLRSLGKPVSFTDILVRRLNGPLVAAVTTNENGFYRVAGLTPGTYRLGILYDGSAYQRHGVTVDVPDADSSVVQKIGVEKGAVVTVSFRVDGSPARSLSDELRDSTGHPILANYNDGRGHVTYTGLRPGSYTVAAANDTKYVLVPVKVSAIKEYDLGNRDLTRSTLTITGTTAPYAVVEAKTGQECPPEESTGPGAFQFIEKADADGRFVMRGVVPGLYMLGADGWPNNYAPRCWPDITITKSVTKNLPIEVGGTASGRLVYAATGTPVITTLAYELHYPPGSLTNPTAEHPARDRTSGASGNFLIDRLSAGSVTGALSQGADSDQITSPKFLVIFPFQDFTPYYLTSKQRAVDVKAGEQLRLGDVPLYLRR